MQRDDDGAIAEFREAIARQRRRQETAQSRVHDRLASVLRAAGRTQEAMSQGGDRAFDAGGHGRQRHRRRGAARRQVDAAIGLLQAGHPDQAVGPASRLVGQARDRWTPGSRWEWRSNNSINSIAVAIPERRRPPVERQRRQAPGPRPAHIEATRRGPAAYNVAIALDASAPDLHNDLGVLLAEMGRFAEAEPHLPKPFGWIRKINRRKRIWRRSAKS